MGVNEENKSEENNVVEKKPIFTVKNVLRVFSLLGIIFVFCPSFLVSCSGQKINVSVITAIGGFSSYGERVVVPHPLMLICLLIPIAALVLLFIKKFSDKKTATIILIGTIVDFVVWFIFRISVKKIAVENFCDFKVTAWFVFNMIVLFLMIVLTALVVFWKLEMDSDLIRIFSGAEKIVPHMDTAGTSEVVQSEVRAKIKVDVLKVIDKVKQLPKKIFIGGAVAIVAVVVIICVALNSGKTIKLNDYLIVDVEGYEGYGTANVTVDWDKIEEKYGEKLAFTRAAKSEYGVLFDIMTPIETVQKCVSIEVEKNSGLSNGEVISYTWDVDEELSKYVKCKVKFKDGDFKVSGLTEVGTFDAFADLTVEFTGVAPNGMANLNYTGSEVNYYDFECDKTNGLSNGDTIKVSINESNVEYYARNLGKVPVELEKEYKVDGLESYLSKLAEIDDVSLASMQQQASDVYNAKMAQNSVDGESLETFTYMGNYLLTVKDQDSWGANNYLFLVYKAQVRNTYSNNGQSYDKLNDIYWYIGYENIMVGADGTVNVDLTNYSIPSDRIVIDSEINSGWFSTMTWNYYGYETLDNLYKTVVTTNIDSYNHEDNVDESLAPKSVEEAAGTETTLSEDGYILANSATELLTTEDLEGLSAEDCKIARNEIYARHGRKFTDEDMQAYFNACEWYSGTIEPEDFQESELSDIEIANNQIIVEYEEEKGYR